MRQEENMPPSSSRKKSSTKKWMPRIATLLPLLLLLIAGLHQCGYIRYPWEGSLPTGSSVGGNIQEGTPGTSREELITAMQEKADKSTVSLKINARPIFEDGNSQGDLYIVNPVNNAYHMNVIIRLDDTDEVIYESGMMAPNQYIDSDTLLKKLEKGEHPATAYMHIFDAEDLEHSINTSTASLIIQVKN
ncbi:hypothetical protein SDC9_100014 [bioreactor metagenome]|uniref:Uncharacterized protein n=1 Tax=bioreactor metagenome TaxID=1076179 RepID=A0A645AJA6_9ZZZZ